MSPVARRLIAASLLTGALLGVPPVVRECWSLPPDVRWVIVDLRSPLRNKLRSTEEWMASLDRALLPAHRCRLLLATRHALALEIVDDLGR